MARAALLERLKVARVPIVWRVATVRRALAETASAQTVVLEVPGWPGHVAGQHVDVRLTAEDGYQAQRSYSIASAPEDGELSLTIERIDDGEVSPYLTEELREGDELELRGPVGGHFTWRVDDGGPLLMIAGGSGVVPLMAMLRHRAARGSEVDTRMLVSARSVPDILYREELSRLAAGDGFDLYHTLTREAPEDWHGFTRRVDREMLAEVGPDASARPRIYVCGPTGFVENAADLLVELGHDPAAIHAERFGPTGA
jgi:ferredoxin-NADP reductase